VRRIRPFEFHANAPAANLHQQIQLRTTMHGVKPRLIRLLRLQDFFQRKSLPRRAEFGVRLQFGG